MFLPSWLPVVPHLLQLPMLPVIDLTAYDPSPDPAARVDLMSRRTKRLLRARLSFRGARGGRCRTGRSSLPSPSPPPSERHKPIMPLPREPAKLGLYSDIAYSNPRCATVTNRCLLLCPYATEDLCTLSVPINLDRVAVDVTATAPSLGGPGG